MKLMTGYALTGQSLAMLSKLDTLLQSAGASDNVDFQYIEKDAAMFEKRWGIIQENMPYSATINLDNKNTDPLTGQITYLVCDTAERCKIVVRSTPETCIIVWKDKLAHEDAWLKLVTFERKFEERLTCVMDVAVESVLGSILEKQRAAIALEDSSLFLWRWNTLKKEVKNGPRLELYFSFAESSAIERTYVVLGLRNDTYYKITVCPMHGRFIIKVRYSCAGSGYTRIMLNVDRFANSELMSELDKKTRTYLEEMVNSIPKS